MEQDKRWVNRTVLFLASQNVSLFGSSLVQFAIIWYVILTTKSGVMMTITTLCGVLPQILISLPAGVWADRFNRKRLIIGADLLTAVSTFVLALVFILGHGSLWLIFLVSGVRSIGAGIQMPAVNAVLPQLVPTGKLMKVNGINGSIQSFIMLLSPAISGVMMTTMEMGSIYFVDVVTAVIAITILALMDLPRHGREMASQTGSQWEDLRKGLSYLWTHPFLKNLIAFYFAVMFLIVPAAILTPLLVARTFGSEVWKLTASEIAFSAGATIGGFLMAAWGGLKSRIHTIAWSCIAFGILTFSMGISSIFWVYLAVIFITGVTLPAYSISSMTLLQERVEKEYQGRVFGFVQIGSAAAMPLGMLLFGPLADLVKIEWLLVGAGIALVFVGGGMFLDRRLRCAEGGCDPS